MKLDGARVQRSRDQRSVLYAELRAVSITVVLSLLGCVSQVGTQSAPLSQPAGKLYRPSGNGPFPGMVLLPACGGLGGYVFGQAERLKAEGYVAFGVDTLSPRGVTDLCLKGRHTVDDVAGDAFQALAYLRSLPFVDRDRIGVMGWSHGAMAALTAISTQPRSNAFQVAVAFYPDCAYFSQNTAIPVLLLLGARDDWTPPEECVKTAIRLQQQGQAVIYKVYPGAHHGFDQFRSQTVTYRGYTLGYDPVATADARENIRAFLAQYLRRSQP